jgi:hypothetical protein
MSTDEPKLIAESVAVGTIWLGVTGHRMLVIEVTEDQALLDPLDYDEPPFWESRYDVAAYLTYGGRT